MNRTFVTFSMAALCAGQAFAQALPDAQEGEPAAAAPAAQVQPATSAASPVREPGAAQAQPAAPAASPSREPGAAQAQPAAPAASAIHEPSAPEAFDLNGALRSGPPLTADGAAERALQANPTLERARALVRASASSVSRARAMMWPRLELSARYTHIDGFPDGKISAGPSADALAAGRDVANNVSDPVARGLWLASFDNQGGVATIKIPRNQFDFGVQLTWPVSDMFFAMLPALKSAKAATRADEAKVAATAAQIARDARLAFYQLARARGGLAVALEAKRQAGAQLAQIEAGAAAGYLTEPDLLDARARVAATERTVAAAKAGVEIADAALRTMIGAESGPVFGIAEPVFDGDAQGLEGADLLVARALEQRPEVAALQAAASAQAAAIDANAASGYPHLALIAGANYANPNRYVIPPRSRFDPSWQVGAVLSWSPNDTLTTGYTGDNLDNQAAALHAQLDELRRGVQLEVRRTLAQLSAAREAMASAQSARVAAEAAYRSRLAQLHADHATTADLLLTEGQLNQARLAELDAAIDLRQARTNLAYATGS